MATNIGIWVDKMKAYVVYLKGTERSMEIVNSEVENFHPVGGSRSKNKWGPQDVVQDSKYSEREKHQLKRYFDDIVEKLENVDAIALFGPADTNLKLAKHIQSHYKSMASKIKGVEKADSMTENQIMALVNDYYNS
ncbi:hypothetical protein [Zhouia amylolytica]|uniref:Host attachment protein n=1 Tax=Zhouia amylolytica AD3 TaxID=1286632 RepID=W2USP2_9FLAO|nr:hypothetical protein [Zhouia amylolytica]ETN96496.1 hypothetical protein P278_05740 [Zhouia amylolytica AD3]